jgi:predicted SprT family Zn-dependent metalloprotease
MNMITPEMTLRIATRIHECIEMSLHGNETLINEYKRTITFVFDAKLGRTAGNVRYATRVITLNSILFLENVDAFIERTVAHEVAHLMTRELFPNAKQHHGPEFRSIMKTYGVDPSTYHKYDVSSVMKNNTFKLKELFVYTCSCPGNKFKLSKRLHNLISGTGDSVML